MSHPVKGSVIIADGNGKVSVISPTSDNQILSLDSNDVKGAKFIDIKSLLPNQFIKASATTSDKTSSSIYERIITLSVPGENTNPIKSIKILSAKDNIVSNYDIRIQTIDGVTIAEKSFTNNNFTINDMGTLSNLPLAETTIEIQARRIGGNNNSYATILEATINYANI